MPYAQTNVSDAFLKWFKGTAFPTAPTQIDVALITGAPSDNDATGIVEVVNGAGASQWSGYARQGITTSTGWSAISGSSPRAISNANSISFGNASISSGTITVVGYALYDHASGNFLGYQGLTGGSKVINNSDPVSFAAGALALDM